MLLTALGSLLVSGNAVAWWDGTSHLSDTSIAESSRGSQCTVIVRDTGIGWSPLRSAARPCRERHILRSRSKLYVRPLQSFIAPLKSGRSVLIPTPRLRRNIQRDPPSLPRSNHTSRLPKHDRLPFFGWEGVIVRRFEWDFVT